MFFNEHKLTENPAGPLLIPVPGISKIPTPGPGELLPELSGSWHGLADLTDARGCAGSSHPVDFGHRGVACSSVDNMIACLFVLESRTLHYSHHGEKTRFGPKAAARPVSSSAYSVAAGAGACKIPQSRPRAPDASTLQCVEARPGPKHLHAQPAPHVPVRAFPGWGRCGAGTPASRRDRRRQCRAPGRG